MACLEHRRQVSPVRGPQDSSATSARGDGCPNVHAYDKTVLGFDCCSGLLVYAVAAMYALKMLSAISMMQHQRVSLSLTR